MSATRKAKESRDYRMRQSERLRAAQLAAARAREELRAVKARPLALEGDQVEWREEWLAAAVDLVYPVFAERGYSLPDKLRVGVARPIGKKTGCCYPPSASADGYTEIFISAALAEPVEVLDQLVHELCVAVAGNGRPLKKCMEAMDLIGGEGEGNPAWEAWARGLLAKLGPFPHDAMTLPERQIQRGRNIVRRCNACGFPLRSTQLWWSKAEKLRCPFPSCDGVLE